MSLQLFQRRGNGLGQVGIARSTAVSREMLEYGLDPSGIQPAGKGGAVFTRLCWIGGKGPIAHHL